MNLRSVNSILCDDAKSADFGNEKQNKPINWDDNKGY